MAIQFQEYSRLVVTAHPVGHPSGRLCQKPDRQGGQLSEAALRDGRASDPLVTARGTVLMRLVQTSTPLPTRAELFLNDLLMYTCRLP